MPAISSICHSPEGKLHPHKNKERQVSKKVRDIVHNYVYLTPIEELITENPLFLRLHYVHQNSFTYLTYPSAHNTRFSHSLGVMHVAGAIFQAAFARTPSTQLQTFLLGMKGEFERLQIKRTVKGESIPVTLSAVLEEMTGADTTRFFSNAVYNSFMRVTALGTLRENQREKAAIAIILLQSLRMAAMLHDVGHPPFSHIVEYALLEGLTQRQIARQSDGNNTDESTPPTYEGHEFASKVIADEILSGESFEGHRYARRSPNFVAACAAFTKSMFAEDSKLSGLKKTLLSGDVDADRLDYVLRDGRSAGLNLHYDLERLEDAAFLRSDDHGRFGVSYYLGALPTIENFFAARYDLYRWMIYHHDTTRRNLVVQRFIIRLLESRKIDSRLQDLADLLCTLASGGARGDYKNYRKFLDGTLVDMMWSVFEVIEAKKSPEEDEVDLKFYLDVILNRSNFLLPSLCKTPGDYVQLADKAIGRWTNGLEVEEAAYRGEPVLGIQRLNEAIKQRYRQLTEELSDEFGQWADEPKKKAEGVAKYRLAQEIERILRKAVNDEYGLGTYTVYFYYLGSFKASCEKAFELHPPAGGGNPLAIRDLSPTISMLETAWMKSPQVMIYLKISENKALELAEEEEETRAATLRVIRDIVGEALGTYLANHIIPQVQTA